MTDRVIVEAISVAVAGEETPEGISGGGTKGNRNELGAFEEEWGKKMPLEIFEHANSVIRSTFQKLTSIRK